jgi:hypothetical protein
MIDDIMDMTAVIRSILPLIEEQTELQTDIKNNRTMNIDFTRAAESILFYTLREDN